MADKKGAETKDAEVETILKGLMSQPGVDDFLVFNDAGIPVRWSMGPGLIKPGTPNSTNPIPPAIVHHTALLHNLTRKAQESTKRLAGESDGELMLMRLHTRTKEYIVAPGETETLMIVQRSHSAALSPLVKVAEAEQMAALAAASKGGDASKKK